MAFKARALGIAGVLAVAAAGTACGPPAAAAAASAAAAPHRLPGGRHRRHTGPNSPNPIQSWG